MKLKNSTPVKLKIAQLRPNVDKVERQRIPLGFDDAGEKPSVSGAEDAAAGWVAFREVGLLVPYMVCVGASERR